ncbi:MAG: sensor histidine kinase [Humibacillus sp.]|nr:sensor histidine kinase [Humibacillus sp.]MDN5777305.1 sensor histidine kinase [Humibacillus sp.]
MTHGEPSQPAAVATASGRDLTPVPDRLRWGLHLLVAALLVLVAVRASTSTSTSGMDGTAAPWPWVVAGCALVAAIYAAGPLSGVVAESSRASAVWLGLLLSAWVGLLALTPEAVYLAFPWFFLLLHLLPRRAALTAVALTTVAAIVGFAWHQDSFTIAMAIGPIVGAGVVVATVFGYQALHAESEQRRRLIVELDRTRAELAVAEHRAGVVDERARLAREIHDTLAQGLSSIQLLLQAATRSLDPAREVDTARAATLVEQARQAAKDNLAEARRFVQALTPVDLEQSTLAGALRRLCETTTARSEISVTFHEVGPPTALPTPVDVALLRIAQGALANTVQHSGATRADVTLTTADAVVSLDVVDDGRGFDPERASHPDAVITSAAPAAAARGADGNEVNDTGRAGFGLRSMRERVALLGGRLTVESRPGAGTGAGTGSGTAISVHLDRAAESATGTASDLHAETRPDAPATSSTPIGAPRVKGLP